MIVSCSRLFDVLEMTQAEMMAWIVLLASGLS